MRKKAKALREEGKAILEQAKNDIENIILA